MCCCLRCDALDAAAGACDAACCPSCACTRARRRNDSAPLALLQPRLALIAADTPLSVVLVTPVLLHAVILCVVCNQAT